MSVHSTALLPPHKKFFWGGSLGFHAMADGTRSKPPVMPTHPKSDISQLPLLGPLKSSQQSSCSAFPDYGDLDVPSFRWCDKWGVGCICYCSPVFPTLTNAEHKKECSSDLWPASHLTDGWYSPASLPTSDETNLDICCADGGRSGAASLGLQLPRIYSVPNP